MSSIATQDKDNILGLNDHVQRKFKEYDAKMQSIEAFVKEQNNLHTINQSITSTTIHLNDNANNYTSLEGQPSHASDLLSNSQSIAQTSETQLGLSNTFVRAKGGKGVKSKPQKYSKTNDFEDFLAQFEITAEINGCKTKSLYLANSMTGFVSSLLNKLTAEQRRDYSILVQKLHAQYGSENRAEVFRAQLKSKVMTKWETVPEQAIKKLTRQS